MPTDSKQFSEKLYGELPLCSAQPRTVVPGSADAIARYKGYGGRLTQLNDDMLEDVLKESQVGRLRIQRNQKVKRPWRRIANSIRAWNERNLPFWGLNSIVGRPFYRSWFSRSEDPALEATEAKAEGGDADAQFCLGLRLAHDGHAQNHAQAAHWYLKAADQDHPRAQFNLGVMYASGQGVPHDDALSLMWIGKAANLGNPGAQYALGMRQWRISLDEGRENARESRIQAYKWLRLAAAQGYAGSEVNRDSLALRMTPDDVAEGSRRAAAFVTG